MSSLANHGYEENSTWMVDIGSNIFVAELQLFLWCLVNSITVFFFFFFLWFLSYFPFWVLKEMNSKSDYFHLASKLFINNHHARSLGRIILPKPKPLYMVYHLIGGFISEVSTSNNCFYHQIKILIDFWCMWRSNP